MGIGEAVVTVLSDNGAPTPVAWTRLRPPASLMAQLDPEQQQAMVAASKLLADYGTPVDRDSAYERLLAKVAPAPWQDQRQDQQQDQQQDQRREGGAARLRPSWAQACSKASRGRRRARRAGRSAGRCSVPRRGVAVRRTADAARPATGSQTETSRKHRGLLPVTLPA